MKQVTVNTRNGPLEVGCRYIVPGGHWGVTPWIGMDGQPDKTWCVTHIPTGRFTGKHQIESLAEAKEHAKLVASIFGAIDDPCAVRQEQIDLLNKQLPRKLYRQWDPDDIDSPCNLKDVQ